MIAGGLSAVIIFWCRWYQEKLSLRGKGIRQLVKKTLTRPAVSTEAQFFFNKTE